VRQVLNQPNSQCTIAPAPADSAEADSAVALAKRCLCKVTAPEPALLRRLSCPKAARFHGYKPCGEAHAQQQSLVQLGPRARAQPACPLLGCGLAYLYRAEACASSVATLREWLGGSFKTHDQASAMLSEHERNWSLRPISRRVAGSGSTRHGSETRRQWG